MTEHAMQFVGSLGALFLLSATETAAVAANRKQFQDAVAGGDRNASEALDVLLNLRPALNAIAVLKMVFAIAAAFGLRQALFELPGAWQRRDLLVGLRQGDFAAAAISGLTIWMLCGILAPAVTRPRAGAVIQFMALPLQAIAAIFNKPVSALQNWLERALGDFGNAAVKRAYSPGDLAFLLGRELPSANGVDGKEPENGEDPARSIIQNIVELERTRAREIMRPLNEVVALRLGESNLESLKRFARQTGHSKFPVYRERIIHQSGYVSVYDVLNNEDANKNRLEDFVNAAYLAPELMRVNDLLKVFLERRLNVAIVVDEYGACSGWVTRQDLLEEIIGDMADEYDHDQSASIEPDPNVEGDYLCEARIDIDDLNEALAARFPKDGFETLGGWIYDRLGRIPEQGEMLRFEEWELEVLEMQGPGIRRVRMRRGPER